ncbi:CDP-alcohol phosphatidyltransferase family protein [[Clostridium] aminophilum]|uniref:CDP-alcohol phosphatidyltransferase family protein n=1 Tax=[Clostridium] aminophilum TaxID=1526 RepID=UPI0009424FFB|nr:CDP-alcohol phosphatidyltransferase family protein [[Clostridium] aminophilum]
MANIITGFRVLISIVLLFCPVFSPAFYMLYLIAGLSDMIDGTIARRMNTVSEFGARFDTAADFVFAAVCLIKFLSVISMPIWVCVWIVIIALIKIINIISGYIAQRKLVAVHSVMNKVTGVLLFILPLTFSIVPLKYSALPVCAVATFAAVQEGHYIRTVEKRA